MTALRDLPVYVPKSGNNNSTSLLKTVLNTPNLPQVIEQMQPLAVIKLIQTIGVEDCSEILEYLRPEQLLSVLDEELWQSRRVGQPEKFKFSEAVRWIRVWAEQDEEHIIKTFVNLGRKFLATLIMQFGSVQEMTGVAWDLLDIDGIGSILQDSDSPFKNKYGQFDIKIRSKDREIAYIFLNMLNILWENEPDFLLDTLGLCCNRSHQDEFDDEGLGRERLIEVEELLRDDLADAREERRIKQGFIVTERAREILHNVRNNSLSEDLRQFFTQLVLNTDYNNAESKTEDSRDDKDGLYNKVAKDVDKEDTIKQQAKALEAIIMEDTTAVPLLSESKYSKSNIRVAMENAIINGVSGSQMQMDLIGLSNLLLSGCNIVGKKIERERSFQAVLSTCSLMLSHNNASPAFLKHDLIFTFLAGMQKLSDTVSLPLAATLDDIVRNRKNHLIRSCWVDIVTKKSYTNVSFYRYIKEGKFFEIAALLHGLEPVLSRDILTPIKCLLSELPVLPKVLENAQQIKSTQGWSFFETKDDLEIAYNFIRRLPDLI